MRRGTLATLLVVGTCLAACGSDTSGKNGGTDTDGAGDGADAGDGDGDGDAGDGDGDPEIDGQIPVRRLNAREYRNTTRDLFPYAELPDVHIPSDPKARSFDNDAESLVPTAAHVEAYEAAAQAIAAKVVKDHYEELTGCADDTDAACAEGFVATFGRRAFRRPLESDELERFGGYFTQEPGVSDPKAAVELTLQLILMSPQFLYKIEDHDTSPSDDGWREVSQFELATRISYFVWGTMPDEELLTAAENGELGTRAEVRAQVGRMLEDPRARDHFVDYARQWLHVDKVNDKTKPNLDLNGTELGYQNVGPMMLEEFDRFVSEIVFAEEPTLERMLSANESFVNAELALLYGVALPAQLDAEGWGRVQLPATERAGVLTTGAFLTGHGHPNNPSPVLRGVYVLSELMCRDIGAPPPVPAAMSVPEPSDNATNREVYANLTSPDACQVCHKNINPLGFPLEHYDTWGRYRTQEESGLPIDGNSEWQDLTFTDGVDLTNKLSTHDKVQECATVQALRWAFGGDAVFADENLVPSVNEAFVDNAGNFKTLAKAIASSDRFRRYPTQGGN